MISCCLVSQRVLNCNQAGALFQTIRFMILCRKQHQLSVPNKNNEF